MKYLLLFFLTVLYLNSNSQNLTKEDSAKVDNLFYYYSGQIPGAVVGVFQNGKVVYNKNYGLANIETKKPITSNDFFYFSSLSKVFTSLAILRLVQDNKINLEDKLSTIFPDFSKYGEKITIKNLLSHTSGLPKYDRDNIKTNEQLFNYLKSIDSLLYEPGTKWSYSNSDYPLLALVIEKTSGMSYKRYLEKKIFKKLNMTKYHFYEDLNSQDILYGHRTLSAYSFELMHHSPNSLNGESNLYMTLSDCEILIANLFQDKTFENVDLLFKRFDVNDSTKVNYGLGWYIVEKKESIENSNPQPIYWTAGSDNGFSNILAHFPKNNISVLIITNRNNNLNLFEKVVKIDELFEDKF